MTERDKKIICFIAVFGKSYTNVIAKTFFHGSKYAEQVAKNRIRLLVNKYKVLKYEPTGLQSPRNYLLLTEAGKEIATDLGANVIKNPHLTLVTARHNMAEQIAYYWIGKVREVHRTTVKTHSKTYSHTPDLLFLTEDGKTVYVEIELTKKTEQNYQDLFGKMYRDNVSAVLYITESDEDMMRLAKMMPRWDLLRFTTTDRLIESVTTHHKIKTLRQNEIGG